MRARQVHIHGGGRSPLTVFRRRSEPFWIQNQSWNAWKLQYQFPMTNIFFNRPLKNPHLLGKILKPPKAKLGKKVLYFRDLIQFFTFRDPPLLHNFGIFETPIHFLCNFYIYIHPLNNYKCNSHNIRAEPWKNWLYKDYAKNDYFHLKQWSQFMWRGGE